MRNQTPTLVPPPINASTVYLVLDDLGKLGRVWRETADTEANEVQIIEYIINGEYSCPVQVVAFNTAGDWARDVTEEVAARLLDLNAQGRELGASAREFVERVTGRTVTIAV